MNNCSDKDHLIEIGDQNNLIKSESTSIILLRKILEGVTKKNIQNALQSFGEINKIQIITKKHYAYCEFRNVESAINCVKYFNNSKLILGGIEVNCYMIGPESSKLKPQDLNPPSKIVLLTFFKSKVDISTKVVREVFEPKERVKKIIIYMKNNMHALVEFQTEETSKKVFEEFDGKNYKNLFVIRVQYTLKRDLIVKSNSIFQYDDTISKSSDKSQKHSKPNNETTSTHSNYRTNSEKTYSYYGSNQDGILHQDKKNFINQYHPQTLDQQNNMQQCYQDYYYGQTYIQNSNMSANYHINQSNNNLFSNSASKIEKTSMEQTNQSNENYDQINQYDNNPNYNYQYGYNDQGNFAGYFNQYEVNQNPNMMNYNYAENTNYMNPAYTQQNNNYFGNENVQNNDTMLQNPNEKKNYGDQPSPNKSTDLNQQNNAQLNNQVNNNYNHLNYINQNIPEKNNNTISSKEKSSKENKNMKKAKRNMEKYKCQRIENISKMLSHQMIFNLFSQYGKVEAILLSEEFSNINYDLVYNFVFIEFGTNSQAMKCKKMVNPVLIAKNNIRIKLTKYEEIDEVEDFEEDVGETVFYKSKHYLQRRKYVNKNLASEDRDDVHPPSKFLVVENLKAEQVQEICNYITVEGKIVQRTWQEDTKRYLIQMEDLDTAIRAVMHLNNIELVRKQHVKISFAAEKEFDCDEKESQVVVKHKSEKKEIEKDNSLNIKLSEKDSELTSYIDMTPKASININKEFKKLPTNETNGSSTTTMKKKKAEDSVQNRGSNTSKSQFNPKTVSKGCGFESAIEGLVQKKNN